MSRFLVAGFIQIETIVKVDKLPVPYSYFTSVPDMIHTDLGGAGYNEARALTWLGNQVDFMSMIGKEVDYRELEAHANQDGKALLNFAYVLPRLDSMPTAVIMYANGEKQIFEDVKDIRTVEYDRMLFERQIQDKDMILISDCNFCRPLIDLAKRYDKPLAVNVRSLSREGSKPKADFLQAADIIYASDDDMECDPYECINECREKYDPEIMIVGVGSRGVILYTKKDNSILEYKPVKTEEIVNTVGAGNAMFSAFLHYYVKTGDAKEAIKNALMFAACKIGYVGTSRGFMTEEEIEQWKSLIWK